VRIKWCCDHDYSHHQCDSVQPSRNVAEIYHFFNLSVTAFSNTKYLILQIFHPYICYLKCLSACGGDHTMLMGTYIRSTIKRPADRAVLICVQKFMLSRSTLRSLSSACQFSSFAPWPVARSLAAFPALGRVLQPRNWGRFPTVSRLRHFLQSC
jgi:hypothetical protein